MDACDSFYEFDTQINYEFADTKRNHVSDQTNLFQDNQDPLKFGDLGSFCNEESIDLEQYLHLGNTPPNGNGDELLKQFGAYSSSPPVTVTVIKQQINNTQSLSEELASVSLSPNTNHTNHYQEVKPSVIQAVNSSTATNTQIQQLGFQIKQEIEEHSVPEYHPRPEMPPGEEQGCMIAKGDQGNHLGGQQMYIISTVEPQTQSYDHDSYAVTSETEVATTPSGVSNTKKRQRHSLDKASEDYKAKRQRNNVAVRKSREKSKARNKDLQSKVQGLQSENERLNTKVELLTKELTVLRSLFTTVKPTASQ